METIIHHKYSLFLLEDNCYPKLEMIGEFKEFLTKNCFEYIETYPTLVEAQEAQKEYDFKTLIIPTY